MSANNAEIVWRKVLTFPDVLAAQTELCMPSALFGTTKPQLTDTMSTWTLTIALCPELVALITGSADSTSNIARGRASSSRSSQSIRLWSMLPAIMPMHLRVVTHVRMLLEMLEGVLRTMCQRIQA